MVIFLSSTDFLQRRYHEFLISVAERGLWRYRDVGRPFDTHNTETRSWEVLPYPLSTITWFDFYRALRRYVGLLYGSYGVSRVMYIHGTVFLPMNIRPCQHVRRCVYDMFFFNMPNEVVRTNSRVRFRLRFESTTWVGDRMSIDNISCRLEFSDPLYVYHYFER